MPADKTGLEPVLISFRLLKCLLPLVQEQEWEWNGPVCNKEKLLCGLAALLERVNLFIFSIVNFKTCYFFLLVIWCLKVG